MTEFYLVTGFLGAGKTTFLSGFLPSFKGKNLKIIINEFGNSGVDGSLLKFIDAELEEICGGSIFCSCKLDRFESAMNDCLKTNPDVIVVEASGLSDPTNIKKVLNSYENQGKLTYKGCICLVDSVRFHKVYSTARVCKKQLAVADLVIINKVDKVGEEKAKELETTIKETFPYANTVLASFGKVDIKLEDINPCAKLDFDEESEAKDLSLQRFTVDIDKSMSFYELERFINLFAEDTARIKGYVYLNEKGYVLADCVGPMVNIMPIKPTEIPEMGLNVLATKGQDTRKALKNAIALYPDKTKIVH